MDILNIAFPIAVAGGLLLMALRRLFGGIQVSEWRPMNPVLRRGGLGVCSIVAAFLLVATFGRERDPESLRPEAYIQYYHTDAGKARIDRARKADSLAAIKAAEEAEGGTGYLTEVAKSLWESLLEQIPEEEGEKETSPPKEVSPSKEKEGETLYGRIKNSRTRRFAEKRKMGPREIKILLGKQVGEIARRLAGEGPRLPGLFWILLPAGIIFLVGRVPAGFSRQRQDSVEDLDGFFGGGGAS